MIRFMKKKEERRSYYGMSAEDYTIMLLKQNQEILNRLQAKMYAMDKKLDDIHDVTAMNNQ